MKKALLCAISLFDCLLCAWFAFLYICLFFPGKMPLGASVLNASVIAGIALLAAELIAALAYFKFSTDGYFPTKEKPLPKGEYAAFIIAAVFTVGLFALFMVNLFLSYFGVTVDTNEVYTLKTRLILLALGSAVGAYAYFRGLMEAKSK